MELVSGLGLVESVRWLGESVWFADWMAGAIHRYDTVTGEDTVVARRDCFPLCFDVRGEELLVLDGAEQSLLVGTLDGESTRTVDLSGLGLLAGNEVLAMPDGGCFLNFGNFDPRQGFPTQPVGVVAHVAPDGAAKVVATELAFPNGMALVGESTLVVAESHAARLTAFDVAPEGSLTNRRVWAEVPGSAPDGISASPAGTIWYADVPNTSVVEVGEGGAVLTVHAQDRGCFSCAVSPDGTRLAVAGAFWPGGERLQDPAHVWDGTVSVISLR